jgi:hypothetical protein
MMMMPMTPTGTASLLTLRLFTAPSVTGDVRGVTTLEPDDPPIKRPM